MREWIPCTRGVQWSGGGVTLVRGDGVHAPTLTTGMMWWTWWGDVCSSMLSTTRSIPYTNSRDTIPILTTTIMLCYATVWSMWYHVLMYAEHEVMWSTCPNTYNTTSGVMRWCMHMLSYYVSHGVTYTLHYMLCYDVVVVSRGSMMWCTTLYSAYHNVVWEYV